MNSIDSSHMEIFWACGVFDNAMIMPVRLGDTKNKLVVVRGTNTRGQISGYAWELIIGTHVAAFLIKTSNSTHHLCLIQNCSSINSFL